MSVSRRSFLAAALPAAAAGDRIRLGIIGAGSRGQYLFNEIRRVAHPQAAVIAVCDVYRPHAERLSHMAAEAWGARARITPDYQELLGWSDVDAVLIASPDFSHSRILQDAVRAGKDAYCEKPMATSIAGARDAYRAVKASDRVVQVGTQRRSESKYVAAAKRIHSGILGTVTRIDISVNFQEPRWRRDYSRIDAAALDWPRFLMGRSNSARDLRRWREWQLFKESTNGIPGLWMSHFADVVSWFMQDPFPDSAVANGGVFLWKDGREVEDVFLAALTYPKGFLFTFAMSLTNESGNRNLWHGTLGTLDADRFLITGAGSRRPDRIAAETASGEEPVSSHMADFLECVRSRRRPRGHVDGGLSHAVAGCMAAEALAQGRRIGFDPGRLALL